MNGAPDLERHCGSWIIVSNGKPAFETFSRTVADQMAARGFKVLTAAQWLGRFNRSIATGR